jgi:biopolymer transport protein ExbD
MHRAFALPFAILIALQGDAAPAQGKYDCLITINADGTCAAAGLHVPCREIGPKLRQAGIPPNAVIRFTADKNVNYEAVSATQESLSRAGFTNMKVGFITESVR